MLDSWLLGIVVMFTVVHLLGLVYLYRRWMRNSSTSSRASGADTSVDTDEPDADTVITCDDCGTGNDAEYRFCRVCTGELSDGGTGIAHARSPSGRGLL